MRRTLKDFPGPRPKPHEMKAFLDDADEVIGLNGLTAIANGKLPSRVATLYTYSAELTAPVPPLAKDATASDVLTARKMRAEVEKYQKHNDEVEGRKKIADRSHARKEAAIRRRVQVRDSKAPSPHGAETARQDGRGDSTRLCVESARVCPLTHTGGSSPLVGFVRENCLLTHAFFNNPCHRTRTRNRSLTWTGLSSTCRSAPRLHPMKERNQNSRQTPPPLPPWRFLRRQSHTRLLVRSRGLLCKN